MTDIEHRAAQILSRVAEVARSCGRDPASVRVVAVTKRQPIEHLLGAYDAGIRLFGENTAQALEAKAMALDYTDRHPTWHFIGRLQRNKVVSVLSCAAMVQTVDRLELAEALSKRAPSGGVDVLVQVNVGRESQKGGVDPADAVELSRAVGRLPGLRVRGLMAIPPHAGSPRPHFEHLADLLASLRVTPEGREATELSMGMSDDFEEAIACGATMVRLGTVLFGDRLPKE